jgi:hypothetical protein
MTKLEQAAAMTDIPQPEPSVMIVMLIGAIVIDLLWSRKTFKTPVFSFFRAAGLYTCMLGSYMEWLYPTPFNEDYPDFKDRLTLIGLGFIVVHYVLTHLKMAALSLFELARKAPEVE